MISLNEYKNLMFENNYIKYKKNNFYIKDFKIWLNNKNVLFDEQDDYIKIYNLEKTLNFEDLIIFKNFIKDKQLEKIWEDYATLGNTAGQGSVNFPSASANSGNTNSLGMVGSGDSFSNSSKKKKKIEDDEDTEDKEDENIEDDEDDVEDEDE